jgi:hypothetical protein
MDSGNRLFDLRACEVSGATPAALDAFERALAAFQSWRSGSGNTSGLAGTVVCDGARLHATSICRVRSGAGSFRAPGACTRQNCPPTRVSGFTLRRCCRARGRLRTRQALLGVCCGGNHAMCLRCRWRTLWTTDSDVARMGDRVAGVLRRGR